MSRPQPSALGTSVPNTAKNTPGLDDLGTCLLNLTNQAVLFSPLSYYCPQSIVWASPKSNQNTCICERLAPAVSAWCGCAALISGCHKRSRSVHISANVIVRLFSRYSTTYIDSSHDYVAPLEQPKGKRTRIVWTGSPRSLGGTPSADGQGSRLTFTAVDCNGAPFCGKQP